MTKKIPLEVKQLGMKIKESLPDKSYRVIGEVSQPKEFRGNVYLNLKDSFCNIRCIVWKSKYAEFKREIKDGDKITVKGKLDFYSGNGTTSFVIDKLIDHSGEGDMYALFKKYKEDFENKGYFQPNEKLNIPKKIENVLLLTSEHGDAIKDFVFTLDNNNSKLNYDIIDIPVQGKLCPQVLIDKLQSIDKEYDLIVITRGGGSFEDLFGFSQPELVEAIHNFDQPVISAIGHTKDISLLDLVADHSCPTPSLAGQYIVDRNKNFISNMEEIIDRVKDTILNSFYTQLRHLDVCNERVNRIVYSFDIIQQNYSNMLLNQLQNYSFKLKELELRLKNCEVENTSPLLVKNKDGMLVNTLTMLTSILENKDNFMLEINNTKIEISDYKYLNKN